MCGIAGIIGLGLEEGQARVRRALRCIEHRGPDGEGMHAADGVILGMRRLAIIDLAEGDQPIYNEDRSIAVVCNGELYNYIEEFAALEARGHRLQSHSDINLLPHLYEERGRDAFLPCRGMFAAAIWDERNRTLTLGRDRAGKKPLFWARVGSGIAFASELPSILALLGRRPSYSRDALRAFLEIGFVPHPDTIYEGVHALPPGSTLTFSPGGSPDIRAYWVPTTPPPFRGSRRDALDALDQKLRESVMLRLRSDVPVGLFLSGGIDSGLVAAHAAAAGARDLTCFVAEVSDAKLNEAPAARAVASHLGLPIQSVPLDFAPRDEVQRIATLYGQPYGDSSALPSYVISRAAAAHRKVVLNGDGGDEIFAGYRRYWLGRAAPVASKIALPLRGPITSLGGWLARRGGRRGNTGFAARALRGLGATREQRYLYWTTDLITGRDFDRVFPALASRTPTIPRLEAIRGETISADGLKTFQRSDYRLILADDLLPKMDIASMANSLEARSPFLDVPLAEFAWSLPAHWLIGRRTKPLLRDLATRYLPASIIDAPKRGFEVPVARWLKTDLRDMVEDLVLSPSGQVMSLADGRSLRRFVKGEDEFAGNRAQAVWCLLMLELFLRANPATA